MATIDSAGAYLNFTDHLNSSSVTTDNQGNVTNLIDYMPYGTDRVNVQNQSFNPNYKFTDQENDPESGLMNFDARYFNQGIGRFIQSDPLALRIASDDEVKNITGQGQQKLLQNPQALNSYSYTANNPLTYTDPDGQFFFIPVLFVAATLGAGSWASWQWGQTTGYALEGNHLKSQEHAAQNMLALGTAANIATLGYYGLSQPIIKILTATSYSIPIVGSVSKEFNKLSNAAKNAYEAAIGGGKHEGFLNNVLRSNTTVSRIQKSIESFDQLAKTHLGYIKDPSSYPKYAEFLERSLFRQAKTLNEWYRQAQNFIEQANILKSLLSQSTNQ